jgi:hypothetical protein
MSSARGRLWWTTGPKKALASIAHWKDRGLVLEGLHVFHDLPRSAPAQVLLATSPARGQCPSRAARTLAAIDAKPFVGDPRTT